MSDTYPTGQRAAWSKPELRRIDAGSAENRNNTKNDGGQNPPNKS